MTGRCYPRMSPTRDPEHVRQQVAPQDRDPSTDPRKMMSTAAIRDRFEGRHLQAPHDDTQRPLVEGKRCIIPLVDCNTRATAQQDVLLQGMTSDQLESNGTRAAYSSMNATDSSAAKESRLARDLETGHTDNSKRAQIPLPPLITLPLRLVAGARAREGRLEVLYRNTWGTICGKGWDWPAAHVACRAMGFGGVDSLSMTAEYGRGLGRIWLSNVVCLGSEQDLAQCKFYGLDDSTIPPKCGHEHDAGVVCSTELRQVPQVMFGRDDHADSTVRSGGRQANTTPTDSKATIEDENVHIGGYSDSISCNAQRYFQPPSDLGSALDILEEVIVVLERQRPIIDIAELARLSRLRLRLRRLAGVPVDDPSWGSESVATPAANDTQRQYSDLSAHVTADSHAADAEEFGISPELALRLTPEMFAELKRTPRKHKSLEQSKAEFEDQREQEAFDPLANDPVERALRGRREHYVPPELRPPPLRERGYHETLRKPPIQNLVDRRPPSWEEAYQWRYEYTLEQIKLGLAPEGIMRTLGPGPWDKDPGFWQNTGSGSDHDFLLDHELDEDIYFDQ